MSLTKTYTTNINYMDIYHVVPALGNKCFQSWHSP